MAFDRSIHSTGRIVERDEPASVSLPAGRSAPVRVRVCVTCDRYYKGPDELSRGHSLAHHLQQSLAPDICAGIVIFRRVECLSGCRRPANVEVNLRETFAIRLADLRVCDSSHVTSLITNSLGGELSYDEILQLPGLRGHIAYLRSASIP